MTDNDTPLVSIIMPVHNAMAYLERTIAAVRASEYEPVEFVIVDDASTDNSRQLAEKYADLLVWTESNSGPATARNTAARASSGAILFFVDSDVEIRPDTVATAVRHLLERSEIDAVFGSYDDMPACRNYSSLYKNLLHHYVHQNANVDAVTFWAGCGAIRRNAFFDAGGFPEHYRRPAIEDVELGYNLIHHGSRIYLAKEMQVTHLKKWSLFSLIKTDIFQRAVPWTRLARKSGLPGDLNFKFTDRLSGLLSVALLPCLAMIYFKPMLFGVISGAIAFLILILLARLLIFFARKKSGLFAVYAGFCHYFYYVYSSLTYGVVTMLCLPAHLFKARKRS